MNRGELWCDQRIYDKGAADFRRAIDLDKLNAPALTDYAWLLATCPLEKFRNGTLAVALSTQAAKLRGWKDPVSLGTLGCSYAEIGDFRKAIEWQTKALEILRHPNPLGKTRCEPPEKPSKREGRTETGKETDMHCMFRERESADLQWVQFSPGNWLANLKLNIPWRERRR